MPNLIVQTLHNVKIGNNTYKNRMVSSGLSWILQYIIGNINNDTINYIAVGDAGEETNINAVKLNNEVFRKQITTARIEDDVGVFETFFEKNEANFGWSEMGLFLGGGSSKNSGVLIARVRVTEEKTSSKTESVFWEFRIENP